MMQLIIDSGGTKTDWALLDTNTSEVQRYSTPTNYSAFQSIIPPSIISRKGNIQAVHMYGAGMYDAKSSASISHQLNVHFSRADISIHSDMLGCCRATATDQPAIVCILGTGSNSCVYDGRQIVRQIPALGYVMGDEGSGASIGKAIIKAYLYGEMDDETSECFSEVYDVTKHLLLDKLEGESPSAYLASHAKWPSDYPTDIGLELVRQEISAFVTRRVLSYDDKLTYPVHFVGSIAYFYSSLIKEVCQQAGLTVGTILQKPINGLITYHK